MFRKLVVVAVFVALGGTLYAGPFFQRRNCLGSNCLAAATPSPTSTIPLPASRQEEAHVVQPWLLTLVQDDTSSQLPPTALEGIEGTGSKSPIGLRVPDKITHALDEVTHKKIDSLLTALSRKPEPVSISPPVTEETSQRLSRILMVLEWFLYVGGGLFGASKIGPFLQLAARVVSGLPSALKESSSVPTATVAVPSSTQVSGS